MGTAAPVETSCANASNGTARVGREQAQRLSTAELVIPPFCSLRIMCAYAIARFGGMRRYAASSALRGLDAHFADSNKMPDVRDSYQ